MAKAAATAETTAEPVKLTKAILADYLAIRAERLELSRKTDALSRRETPIRKLIETWVRQEMPKGAEVLTRLGCLFRFKPGQRRVDWKQEFIRVAGVDAACELQEHAPLSYSLDVTPTS